jgi:hypothetical protein
LGELRYTIGPVERTPRCQRLVKEAGRLGDRQTVEQMVVTERVGRGAGSSDCFSTEDVVCWSRIQTEAGEDLAAIVRRKETERCLTGGLFFWGVGNPPGSLPVKLYRAGVEPAVVFSIMKTRPRAVDVGPAVVLAWRRYLDAGGRERPLPPHGLVTSRGTTNNALKARHYALVCRSDVRLSLGDYGPFDPDAYRNVSGTGAPIGASQVTALLRRVGLEGNGSYRVNLRATLTQDLWVRLCDPVVLCGRRLAAIRDVCVQPTPDEWQDLVAWVREGPSWTPSGHGYQPGLL